MLSMCCKAHLAVGSAHMSIIGNPRHATRLVWAAWHSLPATRECIEYHTSMLSCRLCPFVHVHDRGPACRAGVGSRQ